MEFNEKLQNLRKQKGLTQEELAKSLYVSRTAISKWEQGRGYPGIESLKAIASFFSVSLDELLSGDELLSIAEKDNKNRQDSFLDLVFGLFDISAVLLLFLPLFALRSDETLKAVSLLSLDTINFYLKSFYLVLVTAIVLSGILTLALQNIKNTFWSKSKRIISLFLNIVCALLFVLTLHPYAATFLFIFLAIKVLVLIKN